MSRPRQLNGCAHYMPGDGLLGFSGTCLNCGLPLSRHPIDTTGTGRTRHERSEVPDALIAILDALDDPTHIPGVQRAVLQLSWTLDSDVQRHCLAMLLYDLARAIGG